MARLRGLDLPRLRAHTLVIRCEPGGGEALERVLDVPAHRAPVPLGVPDDDSLTQLNVGGIYKWRQTGERHLLQPLVIARLQQAVRNGMRRHFRNTASWSTPMPAGA